MDVSQAVVLPSFAPRLGLVACAVLFAPGRAHADASEVAGLLADPARLAARLGDGDPTVGAARARVAAAEAAGRQARVLPNPELSAAVAGIVLGRGNEFAGQVGPTGLGQTSNVSVGISELIELGKRGPRKSAADLRTSEASELAVVVLGSRLGGAIMTLGKLAYVTARRDGVSANLAAARELRDLEKARLDHQDLAPVEYERIDLDTRALEVQLRRAETEVQTALSECRVVLRAPCSASGLDAAVLDAAAPLPATLPEAERAIASRPARAASRDEQAALHWDSVLAERRAIPDPTIGLGYTHDTYQYSGSAPNTLMLSVGIPLPIFDRGKHDAAAARATAKAVAAEDAAEVRAASGEIEALLARRKSLGDTLAQLEAETVPQSTRIIEQTRRAFDLGQTRLADLLLVERAHRDLLLDVLDTRFELFAVRGQLRQALGLDDEVARHAIGGSR